MSEEVMDIWTNLETHIIATEGQKSFFFDPIERVLYQNVSDSPIKLGFGHTGRMIPLIIIGDATKEEIEIDKMKGEVIE